ncbi:MULTISPECIES: hypothetical protein [unclassified Gordonia (in: high G+C Gram-positive bacteria)]|uniref:hypothetical protein n=1 Tax=unclassified Gordonia (in: high G+C Gram-positive bacteria) TaxID=2657482 RepID=UPI0007E9A638|nr:MULTISPECIES: hypothetical protein [unclassified Gordonia (in: high G+C Gram-positive bacteria)]OBC04733.1 hypothetical protein A5785_14405 [Gordonia sp. 852002-50395_SCH5434458]OBC04921.1 hypothetical protein A5786_12030 [Gordonia sp. 852002-50816_SCH5313054-a]OBC20629.1 hypothetical protein A5788_05800 [Gordonia sp. 852002-50816_SCH5313054-c]
MTDHELQQVPVWTLVTEQTDVPDVLSGTTELTSDRLAGLRDALATLSDVPLTTLEAHHLPEAVDRSAGIPLGSLSPLAMELSRLVSRTPKVFSDGGETLYRMVVPAKVAAQVTGGIVKPMTSKAISGGIHSALTNGSKIAAQATFVPVAGKAAVAGAAGGSAGTAGMAAAGAGALTVAAPLVLMAVAVGISAHADRQRQQALERITKLLEKIDANMLADEQHGLEGCASSIAKATAILLDRGQLGISLGLDTAAHTIDTAVVKASSRIAKWEHALSDLDDDRIEFSHLVKAIPTIADSSGEFYIHLQLARLAFSMKRRILVLQAVEHAQMDEGNSFERFMHSLDVEQKEVERLEDRLRAALLRLSSIQLDRSHGIRDVVFSAGEVDKLLNTSRLLQRLGESAQLPSQQPDVTIDIAQHKDGSLVVLPARAA